MTSVEMTGGAAGAAGAAAGSPPQGQLGSILTSGELGGFRAVSDIAACLMPLLSALGWSGQNRQLAEALPHFAESLDIQDLRQVLGNLKYESQQVRIRLGEIDPRLAPCLYLPDSGAAFVVLAAAEGEVTIFNSQIASIESFDPGELHGWAYFFKRIEEPEREVPRSAAEPWFDSVARRFRGLALRMLGITLLTSLLALIVPLFIMTLYDKVVPARSHEMLLYLASGIGVAILFEMALRLIRARILAYVGGRIDLILGAAAFQQVLHLPIQMTERAPIGAQVSRLKQFESVREFFTGALANVMLELPFAIIFIAVIALIAGPLAWIPAVLVVVFGLIALVSVPAMRRSIGRASDVRALKQNFLIEMLSNLRTIKTCAAEPTWSGRYRELAAQTAMENFRTSQLSSLVQTLAQTLMMSAGIATVGLGTLRVLSGDMTVGAMVATMALIWRVLSPLQAGFLSLSRLEQLKLGLRQINQLMALKPEREPGRLLERPRTLYGELSFRHVSIRYTPNAEPALLGVDLDIRPGEIVAVAGPSSSGKSTLLKLIAGLYQPQAGAVLIDGMDIRQIDLGELRDSVAFMPQHCHLFHGTIAQNLRLANPTANDAALSQAVLDAGLLGDIMALPEGFETRITDQLQSQLPGGFKQRLMLARAFVKDVPIYLLDEPGSNLDGKGDAALMRKLQSLRGRATVIVTTHRPSHMRLADRVVYLQAGRLLAAGPPDEILPKILKS